MKVTAADLKELGLIERIIPEENKQIQILCTALQVIWIGLW